MAQLINRSKMTGLLSARIAGKWPEKVQVSNETSRSGVDLANPWSSSSLEDVL